MYIEQNIALHKMKTNQMNACHTITRRSHQFNLKLSSFISAYVSKVQGFIFKIFSLIFKIKYCS